MEVKEIVPDDPRSSARGTDFGYGWVHFDDGSSFRYFGNVYYADRVRFRFKRGWRVVEEMGNAVVEYIDVKRKGL